MFRLLKRYLRTQNTFRSIPILSEKPPKMCPISGFGAIFQTKTGCTFKHRTCKTSRRHLALHGLGAHGFTQNVQD